MSNKSKISRYDNDGIYREYGEDGTLLLEQTSFGSVNPMCEVGKRSISGMGCVTFVPPRPDAHPSGINGGLGASLIGYCDDGNETVSGNKGFQLADIVRILKAIVDVDPVVFSGSGLHTAYRCHYCKGLAKFSADELKFNHVKHRLNCPWMAAKSYLDANA